MVRSLSLWVVLLGVLLCAGCVKDRYIAPAEPAIASGDTADFGLEGMWTEHLEQPPGGFEQTSGVLRIVRDEKEKHLYRVVIEGYEQFDIRFRALKYGDDSDYLIVELEYEWSDTTERSLGLAIRQGERLHVTWLASTNLAKALRADKHSAVLEHDGSKTIVHADPDELLQTIRRHGRELMGSGQRNFVRGNPKAE